MFFLEWMPRRKDQTCHIMCAGGEGSKLKNRMTSGQSVGTSFPGCAQITPKVSLGEICENPTTKPTERPQIG